MSPEAPRTPTIKAPCVGARAVLPTVFQIRVYAVILLQSDSRAACDRSHGYPICLALRPAHVDVEPCGVPFRHARRAGRGAVSLHKRPIARSTHTMASALRAICLARLRSRSLIGMASICAFNCTQSLHGQALIAGPPCRSSACDVRAGIDCATATKTWRLRVRQRRPLVPAATRGVLAPLVGRPTCCRDFGASPKEAWLCWEVHEGPSHACSGGHVRNEPEIRLWMGVLDRPHLAAHIGRPQGRRYLLLAHVSLAVHPAQENHVAVGGNFHVGSDRNGVGPLGLGAGIEDQTPHLITFHVGSLAVKRTSRSKSRATTFPPQSCHVFRHRPQPSAYLTSESGPRRPRGAHRISLPRCNADPLVTRRCIYSAHGTPPWRTHVPSLASHAPACRLRGASAFAAGSAGEAVRAGAGAVGDLRRAHAARLERAAEPDAERHHLGDDASRLVLPLGSPAGAPPHRRFRVRRRVGHADHRAGRHLFPRAHRDRRPPRRRRAADASQGDRRPEGRQLVMRS